MKCEHCTSERTNPRTPPLGTKEEIAHNPGISDEVREWSSHLDLVV